MKTLIIDNYDSFTYNLFQYIGEMGGNPIVVRNNEVTLSDIKKGNYSHIVISPGPGSPDDPAYFGICRDVIQTIGTQIPLLGVCLGHQGIVSAFGGKVIRAPLIRHGKTSVIKHNGKIIFNGITNPLIGMRYHSLIGEKKTMPKDLVITAYAQDDAVVMAIAHRVYPIYGVQFHPESIGTEDGKLLLKNFLCIKPS